MTLNDFLKKENPLNERREDGTHDCTEEEIRRLEEI
jgi:hypothetical protein